MLWTPAPGLLLSPVSLSPQDISAIPNISKRLILPVKTLFFIANLHLSLFITPKSQYG
jgi:hypothetical protein